MKLILLFDLDDTLLTNKMEAFEPAYVKALAKHLSKYVDPIRLIQQLGYATQQMTRNQRPDQTQENVFDRSFYPALGLNRQDIQPDIDIFYQDVFPGLRDLTRPRPEAIDMVKEALADGHTVVIATNPLFPYTATFQRLSWAGLSPEENPISIVSTYETFHFAKPNPAYYAEIIAQLGWPNSPIIMIGNDLDMDIAPAQQMNFNTFWISNGDTPGNYLPTASGSFTDLSQWIKQISFMPIETYSDPQSMTSILQSTPAALNTLIHQQDVNLLKQRPRQEEWSLTEIICHLRDVETEVNLPRLQKICSENNPFLPGINTDEWAQTRAYNQEDGIQALAGFTEARIDVLNLLNQLGPDGWGKTARHAIFGPTEIKELVSFMVTHDRTHLQQIKCTIDQISGN